MNPAFHIIQEETGKGSFSVTTEMFSDLPRSGTCPLRAMAEM